MNKKIIFTGLMIVLCGTGLACQDQPDNENKKEPKWVGKDKYDNTHIFFGPIARAYLMAKDLVSGLEPANEAAKDELKEFQKKLALKQASQKK
jgi:hypothetical protein